VAAKRTNRLSLQQLRETLPVVMGTDVDGAPITWRFSSTRDGLDVFAGALGEPDYIQSTDENLEPSPMYLKLMDDLARHVCDRALAADAAREGPASRVLMRHVALVDTAASNPTGVDENLRYLLLRFHGTHLPASDDAALAPWRGLFAAATSGSGLTGAAAVKEGWRAVCVALLTAPEFHLY
jgi:hypothetical protein